MQHELFMNSASSRRAQINNEKSSFYVRYDEKSGGESVGMHMASGIICYRMAKLQAQNLCRKWNWHIPWATTIVMKF